MPLFNRNKKQKILTTSSGGSAAVNERTPLSPALARLPVRPLAVAVDGVKPSNGFVLPSLESCSPIFLTPPSSRLSSPAGAGGSSRPPTSSGPVVITKLSPLSSQKPRKNDARGDRSPSPILDLLMSTSRSVLASVTGSRATSPVSVRSGHGDDDSRGVDASLLIGQPLSPAALVRTMTMTASNNTYLKIANETTRLAKKEMEETFRTAKSNTIRTAHKAQDVGLRTYDFIMGTHRPLDAEFLGRFFQDLLIYTFRDVAKRNKIRDKAAVKVQYAVRMVVAKKRAAKMRLLAEEEEHMAMAERNTEINRRIRARFLAKKMLLAVAATMAKVVAKEVIRGGQRPIMALRIQRVWRGHKGREEANRRKRRMVEEDKRRRAKRRGRKAIKEKGKIVKMTASERRTWARTVFKHHGWKPDGDLSRLYDPFDYIWKPPQGPKQGLRIKKVRLPVTDTSGQYTILHERNTWVGVPVGVKVVTMPPKPLGCPPCYDTKNMSIFPPLDWGKVVSMGKQYINRYNWISTRSVLPANLPVLVGRYQDGEVEQHCFHH